MGDLNQYSNVLGTKNQSASMFMAAKSENKQNDKIISNNLCRNNEFSNYVHKAPTHTNIDGLKEQLIHKKLAQIDKLKESSKFLINTLLNQTEPPKTSVKSV